MYLTAQKVRPDEAGSPAAINAFLYLHTDQIFPDQVMEILADVEKTKGVLSCAECDRRPGRAVVVSYLDVVAPNHVARTDLETALASARASLANDDGIPSFRLKAGPVAVEFGCTIGTRDQGLALSYFDALRARALKLERDRTKPSWFSDVPLDIILTPDVRDGEQVERYELSRDAIERVARLQRPGWRAPRFWAEPTVRYDYEQDHGDFLPVVLSALINLPDEEIAAMGGVRVLAEGRTIRTWPKREEVESIDFLCLRLTGYPGIASFFEDVSEEYVPSIHPRDEEWRRLADAYDREAERRGDPRRAFRGPYR